MRAFILLAAVLMPVAVAAAEAPSEMQQRTACISDAFRFCASEIPNKARIRACLGVHHDELTMGCREVYDASIRAGQ